MKSEIKKNYFFSKKNFIFIIIFVLLTILLLFLLFWFVLKIDTKQVLVILKSALSSFLGWLFILTFVATIIAGNILWIITIYIRLKIANIKIGLGQYISHIMINNFLGLISPIPIIREAYTVWWLKSVGFKSSDAFGYSFFSTIMACAIQTIVTIPAWIWILINTNRIWSDPFGKIAYLLSFWGMGIYLLTFIVHFFLGNSSRIHYLVARIWNRSKQFLHLHYHTKIETKKTYITELTLRRFFWGYFKNRSLVASILTIYFLIEIIHYLSFLCSVAFISIDNNFNCIQHHIDYWRMFNIENISITANTMIPLPGGNFSIQVILKGFMNTMSGNTFSDPLCTDHIKDSFINNILIFSTAIGSIFPFIGIFWLIAAYIKFAKRHKTRKKRIV